MWFWKILGTAVTVLQTVLSNCLDCSKTVTKNFSANVFFSATTNLIIIIVVIIISKICTSSYFALSSN